VFYKSIDNFIVDVNLDTPGIYRGIAFDEATIPINGESGEIFGIELGLAQSLSFLPAPLDGFLVQANYTFTDATGSVPEGDFADLDSVSAYREIALPSASRHTFNAALGYEKGPVSLRVAGTYRDGYLDEIGSEAEEDRLVDDHFQLDLSAKLRVTEKIQLYYEWVNINNAKYYAYNTVGGRDNLLQYEEYNWTMKAGVKVTF
jgi:TonB-dependent receptor